MKSITVKFYHYVKSTFLRIKKWHQRTSNKPMSYKKSEEQEQDNNLN